jgi:hypothetical protein
LIAGALFQAKRTALNSRLMKPACSGAGESWILKARRMVHALISATATPLKRVLFSAE